MVLGWKGERGKGRREEGRKEKEGGRRDEGGGKSIPHMTFCAG